MTYNINAGRYHVDGLEAVAKVIEKTRPDIVGLQEVDKNARRTAGLDQADWLATRLRMQAMFGAALEHPDGGEYGVALLSRYPIVAHRCLALPHFASDDLRQRMPEAIRHHADEARIALAVTVDTPGRRLHAVVSHFGLTADQRLSQAEAVLGFIRTWSDDGGATVLLGDLNARPDSPELTALKRELLDVCAGTPAALQATRRTSRFDPADLPELARRIDYILASRDSSVHDARVVGDESTASDHEPVMADLLVGHQVRVSSS